jgi:hypothetical protein
MPAITLPNIGVSYGWNVGEDGWKPGMDTNLVMLDSLLHLAVISIANTPPGSPTNGDRYIVGTSPTGAWAGQANRVAVWVGAESAWRFFQPKLGWRAWNAAVPNYIRFNGSAWIDDAHLPLTGGGVVGARVIVVDGANNTIASAGGALGAFEVRSPDNASAAAMLAFHRPNRHAVYLGLDTDNKLKVGGWSLGANAYAIYHEGNPPPSVQTAIFIDQKAAGTDGGTSTSGAFRTRDLNTTVVNEITGMSLASNQITVPAGTYKVRASAVADRPNSHRLRLHNVTDNEVLVAGLNRRDLIPYGSTGDVGEARLEGIFTVAATKTVELQHRVAVGYATVGWGRAVNWDSMPEIYALVHFEKVS